VAVCKAVIARIAPHATILDITHNIRPYAIREAATVLTRAVRYMPESVHLAVVDPGVGSERRGIAVRTLEGSVLVGPDNGLFSPVAAELGGVDECRELTNAELMLEDVSSTFHGRDVFAPVAAHLAAGVDLSEVGPSINGDTLVRLPAIEARLHDGHLHAEVLHVDIFGNLQMSARASSLNDVGLLPGTVCEVRFSYLWVTAPYAGTFSEVPDGGWVLTEDSSGWLSLSINRGNAALTLKAEVGDEISIGRSGFDCAG
jgi:S-adenosylmethionine hydrolase